MAKQRLTNGNRCGRCSHPRGSVG